MSAITPRPALYDNPYEKHSNGRRDDRMVKEDIHDYAENATVHGIAYVLERHAVIFSKIFWLLVFLTLVGGALFTIIKAYLNWQDDPVVTTVSKTGLPIQEIDFPSITICGLGSVDKSLEQVLYRQAVKYLVEQKAVSWDDIPAYQEDVTDAAELLNNHSAIVDFMADEYPGLQLNPGDIAPLLSSKEPDRVLDSNLALAGGQYNECQDLLIDDAAYNYSTTPGYNYGGGGSTGGYYTGGYNYGRKKRSFAEAGQINWRSRKRRNAEAEATTTSAPFNSTSLCGSAVFSNATEYCYKYWGKYEREIATKVCGNSNGDLLDLYDDQTLNAFLDLFKKNNFPKLEDGLTFWTTVRRDVVDIDQRFETSQFYILEDYPIEHLTLGEVNDTSQQCFVLEYKKDTQTFEGRQSDCSSSHGTFCESYPDIKVDCPAFGSTTEAPTTSQGTTQTLAEGETTTPTPDWENTKVDKLLNPRSKKNADKELMKAKKRFKESFSILDITSMYDNLFELLWYSQLPCFDVRNYSSIYPGERSLLKQCAWKGQTMSCSAIFDKFPTDRGMCCTFNMKNADNIFKEGRFVDAVTDLQDQDRDKSFVSSKRPKWFDKYDEPQSQRGVEKGLRLVLDAHTDQVSSSSVLEDFQGFIAVVNSQDSYPLTRQNSIRIMPGHDTLVALNAEKIVADGDIKSIDHTKRFCYFPDEYQLKLHLNYSQASCILECEMQFAQETLLKIDPKAKNCTPWYLPSIGETVRMCDPWKAVDFTQAMESTRGSDCEHCLPDCEGTLYSQTTTAVPFRRCDNKNLGVSRMCNMQDADVAQPPIFGHQVYQEYVDEGAGNMEGMPRYIKQRFRILNSNRVFTFNDIFSISNNMSYDAYEKDIATVEFFFQSPTVFQYHRKARMGPLDFVSQVGGLLGLFIGFSIASGIEVLYWLIYRIPCRVKKRSNDD